MKRYSRIFYIRHFVTGFNPLITYKITEDLITNSMTTFYVYLIICLIKYAFTMSFFANNSILISPQ